MTIIDTLIVHPGTGTIIDAEDGVLIVNIPSEDFAQLEGSDQAVVEYAEQHGTPVMLRPMYAVAVGEQFDRIDFYGPFPYFDDAEEWAGRHVNGTSNWWIVSLSDPRSEVVS